MVVVVNSVSLVLEQIDMVLEMFKVVGYVYVLLLIFQLVDVLFDLIGEDICRCFYLIFGSNGMDLCLCLDFIIFVCCYYLS